jgi:hypothetical protein
MKKLLIIAAIFSSPMVVGQTLVVSDPIQVADNQLYGKTRPRIVINGSGEPVVMWSKASTDQVYVSTLNFGSQAFNEPVKITPDGVQAFSATWSGADIASSGDTVFVTYHSTPESTGKSYVHGSFDGGLSFGDSVRVDQPTIDQSRFPTVAVTDQGNPIVGFMRFEGNWIDPQYAVSNSYDLGATFEQDVIASELAPEEVCDCCPAQVIAGNGFQAISFRNNDNNIRDNWIAFSSDTGASFESVVDVDYSDWMVNSCPSSGPDAFFAGDSLYTVWMSEGQGETRIYVASVSIENGGIGYSGLVRNIPFDGFTENYPRIAGNGQQIGVTYQAWNMGETDAYLISSVSGVTGFTDTIRLGAVQDGAQRNPDIAFQEGVYHIVFDDSEAGHLMYQRAYYENTGITEELVESKIWSDGQGTIKIKVDSDKAYNVEVTNNLGQLIQVENGQRKSTLLKGLPSNAILNVSVNIGDNVISRKLYVK